jgi:hypothetical protein
MRCSATRLALFFHHKNGKRSFFSMFFRDIMSCSLFLVSEKTHIFISYLLTKYYMSECVQLLQPFFETNIYISNPICLASLLQCKKNPIYFGVKLLVAFLLNICEPAYRILWRIRWKILPPRMEGVLGVIIERHNIKGGLWKDRNGFKRYIKKRGWLGTFMDSEVQKKGWLRTLWI